MQPIIVSGTNDIFTQGSHLAFFGRSNVGKSSTINALLNNKNAAKTSAKPGKTITFNFFDLTDGKQERFLVDLPGYGYARYGEQFREKLRRRLIWYVTESGADIENFCLVLDAKAGLTEIDRSAIDLAVQTDIPLVVLVNKTDKLNQKQLSQISCALENEPELKKAAIFYYSAKTGRGVKTIRDYLELQN